MSNTPYPKSASLLTFYRIGRYAFIMRYVLFDIDGTLIDSGGAGVRSLNYSFRDEFKVEGAFAHINMAGKTDLQIIKEALSRLGIPESNGILPSIINRYLEHLRVEIQTSSRHMKPGVMALLDALSEEPNIRLGLLTGNLEQGARIKLEAFGLNRYFPIGAFGSDSEDRNRLLPIAVERLKGLNGYSIDYKQCIVVGDTPRDVFSAKPYGALSIAVATGPYPKTALKMAEPDLLLKDLTDIDSFIRFVLNSY